MGRFNLLLLLQLITLVLSQRQRAAPRPPRPTQTVQPQTIAPTLAPTLASTVTPTAPLTVEPSAAPTPAPTLETVPPTLEEHPSTLPLYIRPRLMVHYDRHYILPINATTANATTSGASSNTSTTTNTTTPGNVTANATQLYLVHISNRGPGDVCRLALSIEGWNRTVNWWNLDVLDHNQSYQYMPTALSIHKRGRRHWRFGFELMTDNASYPRIDPLFGQTCDGRFFNYTNVIPSPPNPSGTNAKLEVVREEEFMLEDIRRVLVSGHVINTGTYPICGAGLEIQNFTASTSYWGMDFDPWSNTTLLPSPILPNASTSWGVIMPMEAGYPNVTFHYVSACNQILNLTAPDIASQVSPAFRLPQAAAGLPVINATGGWVVPYPPTWPSPTANATSPPAPTPNATAVPIPVAPLPIPAPVNQTAPPVAPVPNATAGPVPVVPVNQTVPPPQPPTENVTAQPVQTTPPIPIPVTTGGNATVAPTPLPSPAGTNATNQTAPAPVNATTGGNVTAGGNQTTPVPTAGGNATNQTATPAPTNATAGGNVTSGGNTTASTGGRRFRRSHKRLNIVWRHE